jgi:pilus assembly protein CpaC
VNNFGIPNIAGVAAGAGGFNNLPAALDNGQVRLAISALRTLNYARTLAEPNLTTMNGQPAYFHAGGQFPVPIVTGYTQAGLQGVNFVPYGVSLSFTPYITDRDRVRLNIAAEVSTRDLASGTANVGGTNIPNINTRNFTTTVELREGQTLAVAGLIQNNPGADSKRVPLLGDLPLIGRMFSFDRITAGEQELVILITPELVRPLECHELLPLPGSNLFEPSDLEFYLCGRLESHHLADHRSAVRTDVHRQLRYRQMENLYLPGPTGHMMDIGAIPGGSMPHDGPIGHPIHKGPFGTHIPSGPIGTPMPSDPIGAPLPSHGPLPMPAGSVGGRIPGPIE